jgi:hypothetical protein
VNGTDRQPDRRQPRRATACQQIDHVQVDAGSVGLALIAGALTGAANPRAINDPTTSSPLYECVPFADGYSWGSVVAADVQIGSRTVASLLIHLMGDTAAGNGPADCVSGPRENAVIAFGANGVLGVGNFLQDCGEACASSAQPAAYYVCSTDVCSATAVALGNQITNPVAALPSDNNGVVISLPAVAEPSGGSVTGTRYLGVGTQTNNALGSAQVFAVDNVGALDTHFNGATVSGSVIDSGSDAYFFTTNSLATYSDYTFYYCPASSTP